MVITGLYTYYSTLLACTGSVLFVGLKQNPTEEAKSWPVEVFNVNGVSLSFAGTKADYIAEWNADAANQAVGVLGGTYGPFGFEITLKCDVDVSILSSYFVIPQQTIQSATLATSNGQSVTVSGLTKLIEFVVDDPGAPMSAGDDTFTNAYLTNKKIIVIVSGIIPPIDTTGIGTGQDANALYVSKTLSSDSIFFNGGLGAGQNVQIYAYS